MEAVRAFNNELSSVYDSKPPISRAKMSILTKSALKAIKFYKHVVQSVEKFIHKCRPEYKVPGLYVMDSIVRQSRHQFGADRDVFAPRFCKNIVNTFQNLFKCPPEQKTKIVRVLNLWQKNNVFPSDVIQPLMDLVSDPNNLDVINRVQEAIQASTGMVPSLPPMTTTPKKSQHQSADKGDGTQSGSLAQADVLRAVTQLVQQSQQQSMSLSAQQNQLQQLQLLQQQLMHQSQMLQHGSGEGQPLIDGQLLAQIQTLTTQLLTKTEEENDQTKPDSPQQDTSFNKKLLDFDYGESDEEEGETRDKPDEIPGDVQNILNNPGMMAQIHQMSANIQRTNEETSTFGNQQNIGSNPPQFPFMNLPPNVAQPQMNRPPPGMIQDGECIDLDADEQPDMEIEDQMPATRHERGDRHDRDRHHRRSRSRDRSHRRRSRSRDRDRRSRRSRSRDRHSRRSSRSKDHGDREKHREKREKDRERRKMGLPHVRDEHVSVCSTTLWLGHLSKSISEDDIKAEMEFYGEVVNVAHIPPRGCAFVTMSDRKTADKAMYKLKGSQFLGSTLKMSWSISQGVKDSHFKDLWDMNEGATYIPWSQFPKEYSDLIDGAVIDDETLPPSMKAPEPVDNQYVGMDMVGEGQPGNMDLTQPPPGSMEEGGNMIQSLAPPVNNLPPPTSLMPGQPGGPPPPLPGMSLSGMMPLLPGMNLPPGGIVVAGGASQFPGMPGKSSGVLPGAQGQPPLPVTPGGPPPNMPHLIPGTTIFQRGLAPMITGPGAPPMQMSNMLPGQQPPLLQGQPGQPFEPLEMKSNMTRPLGMHLQAISSAGLTITSPSMIRAGLRPPPFAGQLQSPIATSTAPGFVPRLAGGLLGRGIGMSAPNRPPPTMGGGPTPLMSTDSGLLSPGAGPTGNRPLLGQSPNVSRFSTPGTAKKSISELLNEWSTKNVHNDMEDNQDCGDSWNKIGDGPNDDPSSMSSDGERFRSPPGIGGAPGGFNNPGGMPRGGHMNDIRMGGGDRGGPGGMFSPMGGPNRFNNSPMVGRFDRGDMRGGRPQFAGGRPRFEPRGGPGGFRGGFHNDRGGWRGSGRMGGNFEPRFMGDQQNQPQDDDTNNQSMEFGKKDKGYGNFEAEESFNRRDRFDNSRGRGGFNRGPHRDDNTLPTSFGNPGLYDDEEVEQSEQIDSFNNRNRDRFGNRDDSFRGRDRFNRRDRDEDNYGKRRRFDDSEDRRDRDRGDRNDRRGDRERGERGDRNDRNDRDRSRNRDRDRHDRNGDKDHHDNRNDDHDRRDRDRDRRRKSRWGDWGNEGPHVEDGGTDGKASGPEEQRGESQKLTGMGSDSSQPVPPPPVSSGSEEPVASADDGNVSTSASENAVPKQDVESSTDATAEDPTIDKSEAPVVLDVNAGATTMAPIEHEVSPNKVTRDNESESVPPVTESETFTPESSTVAPQKEEQYQPDEPTGQAESIDMFSIPAPIATNEPAHVPKPVPEPVESSEPFIEQTQSFEPEPEVEHERQSSPIQFSEPRQPSPVQPVALAVVPENESVVAEQSAEPALAEQSAEVVVSEQFTDEQVDNTATAQEESSAVSASIEEHNTDAVGEDVTENVPSE